MLNRRILLLLTVIPMVCYVLMSGARTPSNSESAPKGYGMCYGGYGGVCYGYGVCYGWEREALDWGLVAGCGLGGYLLSRQEPYFEEPLIPGSGDRTYKEERVPDWWLWAASTGTVGLTTLLPNQDGWLNARSYRHLKGSAQAATSAYFLKDLGKNVVGRPRPDYFDRLEKGMEVADARKSFPSGHAAHAANVATYLSIFTWDEWRSEELWVTGVKSGITALLAGGACWVSWTRVADHRHYPGDAVAGAVLGASTALFFYSWQQWWGAPEGSSDQPQNIQTAPISIGVRFRF